MEMPLVSIILPVYNAQSHLNRCLGSICAQQYEDLEIIVINDGSKDQSLPVCEEFRKKDSRILLVDKANSGVSDTRNLGLKLASGKYVQFVDSDDYIAPDYTARLVEAAEQSGADLVISPYTMVIPAGASKPEQVLDDGEITLHLTGQVLYAGAYDHQISQIIFHGKKNTYVYDTTDIRLHTKSYLKFYENIPVPLQGMEADDYEIYVVYQNEFYDLEQNIKIK
mgnify:CR=1 FL=1